MKSTPSKSHSPRRVRVPGWAWLILAALLYAFGTAAVDAGGNHLYTALMSSWGVTQANLPRAPFWIKALSQGWGILSQALQAAFVLLLCAIFCPLWRSTPFRPFASALDIYGHHKESISCETEHAYDRVKAGHADGTDERRADTGSNTGPSGTKTGSKPAPNGVITGSKTARMGSKKGPKWPFLERFSAVFGLFLGMFLALLCAMLLLMADGVRMGYPLNMPSLRIQTAVQLAVIFLSSLSMEWFFRSFAYRGLTAGHAPSGENGNAPSGEKENAISGKNGNAPSGEKGNAISGENWNRSSGKKRNELSGAKWNEPFGDKGNVGKAGSGKTNAQGTVDTAGGFFHTLYGKMKHRLWGKGRILGCAAAVSALCGAIHGISSPFSGWLVMNTFLLSVLSCVLYEKTGGIWAGVGVRTGLIWTLQAVLGMGGASGVYELYFVSRAWLSGGELGPMGGMGLAVIQAAALAVAVWRPIRKNMVR